MKIKSVFGISILFTIIMILSTSCRKNRSVIPYVAVDKEINITLPGNFNLAVIGGWMYISGGSKGILVYRRQQDEFVAYDRHCPYNVDAGCVVEVDSSNIEIIDPCSGSKFSLYDGSATIGPATLPLKQYATSFDGTNVRIYN